MVVGIGTAMAVPVTPNIAAAFDVSLGSAAQIVTAGAVASVIFLIPSGIAVDRLGRRFGLVAGPILMASASLATALAPSFVFILFAQLLAGAGSTLWQIGRELAAMDVVRPDQRGRALSGFFGLGSVGQVLGPVLGGFIADAFSFRAVFLVSALLALAILPVAFTIRTGTRRAPVGRRRFDIGLGRLREIQPIYRVTFFIVFLGTFAAMLRGSVTNSMLPLYAGSYLGHSTVEIGLLFSVMGAVNLAMIGPAGYISDKLGRKAAAAPASILAAVAFVAYPFATSMPALIAVSVVAGLGTGFALGSMSTYSYDIIPEHARGQLQAFRRTFGQLGHLTGPVAGGALADRFNPGMVFLFMAPVHIISALLFIFVARETLPTKAAPNPDA